MNTSDCRCYVRTLAPEALFTLRYGAHALECPIYRPSLDPVDRAYDNEAREHFQRQAARR